MFDKLKTVDMALGQAEFMVLCEFSFDYLSTHFYSEMAFMSCGMKEELTF